MAAVNYIRTCSVLGCASDPKHLSRGFCSMHYQRVLKYGDPGEAAPRVRPAVYIDGLKICRGCGEAKPPTDYYVQTSHAKGVSHYCKQCAAVAVRERRLSDPHYREKRRADYAANRERRREEGKRRYRADPIRAKLSTWRAQGIDITAKQYRDIHSAQDGKCAICGKDEPANGKALAVDHDHDTGSVRGLLCDDCNRALGLFQDSPEVLRRALDYLGN